MPGSNRRRIIVIIPCYDEKQKQKGRSGKVGRIEDGDDGRMSDEDGSWLLVSVSPVLVLVLGLEARSCCC